MTGVESASTGLCLVRAEPDASAGVLITVTVRPDLDNAEGQTVLRTADIDEAVHRVHDFLVDYVTEATAPR